MNNDIFLHILDWVPPATLSSVCRASHDAREIVTPLLYRSVDLTVDNASSEKADTGSDPTDTVKEKQLQFLTTLSQHPEYSSFIKRFAWTSGLLRDAEDAELLDEVPYVSPELHLFESLSEVRDVSIRSGIPWVETNPQLQEARATTECDALFPEARSMDVRGRMNDTLARSMLERKRRDSLRSLSIDELPESADTSDDDVC